MTEEHKTDDEAVDDQLSVPTGWEFPHDPPDLATTTKMMAEMPDWFGGIRPEDYVDYVQPLSQNKKIKQPDKTEQYVPVWTLYITVAGRQAAINQAAWKNGWRVDFEPEPITPTGIPGYVQYDKERIVYREYAVIIEKNTRVLGRKPGTAWVPGEGGSGAVKSNRFEKVETAARGRAIAAWGIGVLPGSGVASLDEMNTATELAVAARSVPQGRRVPKNKEEAVEDARMALLEYQQGTGQSDEEVFQKAFDFCVRQYDKTVTRTESGAVDFGRMKVGEIVLFTNAIKTNLQQVLRDQPL